MFRRVLISMTVVAMIAVGGNSLSAASPVDSAYMALQDEESSAAPVPPAQLSLGERFSTETWELEVQDAFIADSLDRAAYVEIRASVAFRTLGGQSLPYEWGAFTGQPGYPNLQIVDSGNVVYPIDIFEPGHTLVPGSNLVSLEPFVPARWTVGFEANGPQSETLSIQAVWDGVVVAEWDVYSTVQPLQGWAPHPGAEILGSGAEFEWDDQVIASLIDHGIESCADAATQPVFTAFAVQFAIENSDTVPGLFPNVLHSEPTAIAIWNDGSSARSVSTTDAAVVGLVPTDDNVVINIRSQEQIIVRPMRSSADSSHSPCPAMGGSAT